MAWRVPVTEGQDSSNLGRSARAFSPAHTEVAGGRIVKGCPDGFPDGLLSKRNDEESQDRNDGVWNRCSTPGPNGYPSDHGRRHRRAEVVANFLVQQVSVHVSIKIIATSTVGKVMVITTKCDFRLTCCGKMRESIRRT